MNKQEKITVGITRYREPDELLINTIKSVLNQQWVKVNIIFIEQFPSIYVKHFAHDNSIEYLEWIDCPCLSSARNKMINLCRTDVIILLDVDAEPIDANWAKCLCVFLEEYKNCGLVFGKLMPQHNSIFWKIVFRSPWLSEIYSCIDLWEKTLKMSKWIWWNSAILLSRIPKILFREDLWRRPGKISWWEDSYFCKELIQQWLEIYYLPQATVKHYIDNKKLNLLWLCKRIFEWGRARTIIGGKPSTFCNKKSFMDIIFQFILAPIYISGYVYQKIYKS